MANDKPIVMLKIDNKSVTSELDRAGYKKVGVLIKQVENFKAALEKASSNEIDVILINMDIPGFDVFSALKKFKSMPHLEETPIVVTSVQGHHSIQKKVLESGADLFVEQPFPRQFLVEKIKNLLSKQTRNEARISGEAQIEFKYNNKTETCVLADVSGSGVLVLTTLDIPAGDKLELKLLLPGYQRSITIVGQVVRSVDSAEHGRGIGIRFLEFIGDARKKLDKYITKSSANDANLMYYL